MRHCVSQLKDHHIAESDEPTSKQSRKFRRKSGFNFAAFVRLLGMIPVT